MFTLQKIWPPINLERPLNPVFIFLGTRVSFLLQLHAIYIWCSFTISLVTDPELWVVFISFYAKLNKAVLKNKVMNQLLRENLVEIILKTCMQVFGQFLVQVQVSIPIFLQIDPTILAHRLKDSMESSSILILSDTAKKIPVLKWQENGDSFCRTLNSHLRVILCPLWQ